MVKKCINWTRIFAVAGVTLTSTLIATGLQVESAIANALLLAGLALFTELKLESEPLTKVQAKLSMGVIL
jgi:hypothetical protein